MDQLGEKRVVLADQLQEISRRIVEGLESDLVRFGWYKLSESRIAWLQHPILQACLVLWVVVSIFELLGDGYVFFLQASVFDILKGNTNLESYAMTHHGNPRRVCCILTVNDIVTRYIHRRSHVRWKEIRSDGLR